MLKKQLTHQPQTRFAQTKFSFGSTSAIITNLALIAGLDHLPNSKISIIGGILVIALADNISDSFGIHIFQESEWLDARENWISTLTNFTTRLLVSLAFVLIVLFSSSKLVFPLAILWGTLVLAFISYLIARAKRKNPLPIVLEHLVLLFIVVMASNFLGNLIQRKFYVH